VSYPERGIHGGIFSMVMEKQNRPSQRSVNFRFLYELSVLFPGLDNQVDGNIPNTLALATASVRL